MGRDGAVVVINRRVTRMLFKIIKGRSAYTRRGICRRGERSEPVTTAYDGGEDMHVKIREIMSNLRNMHEKMRKVNLLMLRVKMCIDGEEERTEKFNHKRYRGVLMRILIQDEAPKIMELYEEHKSTIDVICEDMTKIQMGGASNEQMRKFDRTSIVIDALGTLTKTLESEGYERFINALTDLYVKLQMKPLQNAMGELAGERQERQLAELNKLLKKLGISREGEIDRAYLERVQEVKCSV